ncbi:hypothetical protein A0H81_00255 [Grifola frondosa]|uniref:Uncharacterized protein n=1 Tax=Grifola frondosa TaxID=5627 RepID=A0A1C7MP65_GRIFR|nr:hypothetical protein A0H81_00255 [Grifola frondosa]
MSTRKRKFSPDLQGIFEEIQSILTKIKPKLNDSRQSAWIPLRTDLLQIAVLAESFTKQRPRSNKEWRHLADTLDREGVNLWNASTLIREATDDGHRSIFAALRLAGFRLIEAGLEQKPGIETLTHVLQLASKAGASLSEIGSNDLAASVLGCAAKYEESLRSTDDPQGVQARSRARATMVYYSSRMEAAWREGNDGIADFMLEKVTENDQCLSLLPPPDRTVLAAKLLEIGKTLLRTGSRDSNHSASNARKSIKWIQKSFSIIEPLEDAGDADNRNLKRSILRSLARAYFLSSSEDPDNLTRAEASLHELIASVDSSVDHTSAEYQQLRWMRIAILKRRKAGTSALLDAFQSIIDIWNFQKATLPTSCKS